MNNPTFFVPRLLLSAIFSLFPFQVMPAAPENLDRGPHQSPGAGSSHLASISDRGDEGTAPAAGVFASVRNQSFDPLAYAADNAISRSQTAVRSNANKFLHSSSPSLGNSNGEIILIEFMDYQCPHCKNMEPVIAELISKNPSLKVVIKELPILGSNSEYAAKAALASTKQNKFFIFHKTLLSEKGPLTREKVLELAKGNGLDVEQLKKDIEDPVFTENLKQVRELAKILDLHVTPYFVFLKAQPDQDQIIVMPGERTKDQLQESIDSMRGAN